MKVLPTMCLLFFIGIAQAQTEMFVTKVYTKTLYIYNSSGEELKEIKAKVVKDALIDPIPGKDIKGLRIDIEKSKFDEGLVRVSLDEFPEGAWIETMAVEIWPENRLTCPEVTTGQAEVDQSSMTIGFGEHCEESGE